MRQKIVELTKSIFSIFILIAIAGGVIVFCMLLLGIIIGGEAGGNLAVSANKVYMPHFIKCATVAMTAGLINFYATRLHTLSLDEHGADANAN